MSADIDLEENQTEMVLVPRHPTKSMLKAAWCAAHDEDAVGVWRDMIEAWLQDRIGNSASGSG
jgi:hypothetical protein